MRSSAFSHSGPGRPWPVGLGIHATSVSEKFRLMPDSRRDQSLQSRSDKQDSETHAGAVALAVFLVMCLYSRAMWNGFIYDDLEVILEQPSPGSVADVLQIFSERHFPGLPYYRPVTRSSLLLQKTLHGDVAAYFHLANAALAGLATLLVYLLLRLPVFRVRFWPALWAASICGLHPIASSCVYPIASGRETLLPGCLVVASVYTFICGGRTCHVLSLICFTLALFSKEQAVVIPALFVLADVLRLTSDGPDRDLKRWALRYATVAVPVAAYFSIRWTLFGGSEYRLAVLEQPLGPLWSLLYSVQTMFAPFAQLHYEPPVEIWYSPFRTFVPAVVFLGLLTGIVRLNAESRRLAVFWVGWGLLTLAPTANFLDQEAKFAERYVLLALVGTAALAALWMSSLQEKRPARFAATLAILAVALSAAVSWQRCEYFQDEITFHSQWARTNPSSVDAHVHFGLALHDAGRIDEAIEHHQAALEIDPNYAGAHINLGNSLLTIGQPQDALHHYQQVLDNPEYPEHHAGMHFNMALVYERLGNVASAITHYQAAVEAEPDNIDAHISLGNIHFRLMEYELSSQHFQNALKHVAQESLMGQQLQDSIRQAEARIQKR